MTGGGRAPLRWRTKGVAAVTATVIMCGSVARVGENLYRRWTSTRVRRAVVVVGRPTATRTFVECARSNPSPVPSGPSARSTWVLLRKIFGGKQRPAKQ